MKTLTTFLKKLKILVEKSRIYETIFVELLIDMKNLFKIVEVTCNNVETFCSYECLSLTWGNRIYNIIRILYF